MKMTVLCTLHEFNNVMKVKRAAATALKLNRFNFGNVFVPIPCQTLPLVTLVCKHHAVSGFSQLCFRERKYEFLCIRGLHVRSNSSLNHKHKTQLGRSVIAKFSEEIDLDALKTQRLKELRENGNDVSVAQIVKKILAEKCDDAISKLSPEDQKKLKTIQLEHNFMYSEGYAILSSDEMTSENWLEALNITSMRGRLKYYIYCMKRGIKKDKKKDKVPSKQELGIQNSNDRSGDTLPVNDNKIMLRLYDSTMKRWINHRLAASMQFGTPLVLDMDYTDYMDNRLLRNSAKQIMDVYCLNRNDTKMPFHLHLTGCPPDNPTYRLLQLLLNNDPHFMVSESPKSYLEIFDKERLVYLSPNGKQIMRHFDPNAVYIIGAYNDKGTQRPVSYSRAKEQGIKCQRLPLDQYLKWGVGNKALTLDQMIKILQSVKNQESWLEAFKAIPARKLAY